MLCTQVLLALQALALGVLDLTGNISLPVVWGLSLFLASSAQWTIRRVAGSSPSSCRSRS